MLAPNIPDVATMTMVGHDHYRNNWSIPFRFLEFIDEQEG